jgi:hypothetical protein
MTAFHWVPTHIFDNDFAGLSRDAQVLELASKCCRHRASEGLFRWPLGYIEADLSMTREDAEKALSELIERRPYDYDFDTGVFLDKLALRDNPIKHKRDPDTKMIEVDKNGRPKKDKRTPGALSKLKSLPDTHLLQEFVELADRYSPDLAADIREAFPELDKALHAPSDAPLQGPWHGARREETLRPEKSREDDVTGRDDELERVNAEW